MGVTEKETKNQVVAAFAILWRAKKIFLHQINFKQTTTKSTGTKKIGKLFSGFHFIRFENALL